MPLREYYDSFISVSEGIKSVTMIFDDIILEKMKTLFNEHILEYEDDLAAIIVESPEEIIKTPGCALVFYNQLARRRINIEDTISCYTDTIIVVKMDDVARAFNALTELIVENRNAERQ
jgi:aspartokinase